MAALATAFAQLRIDTSRVRSDMESGIKGAGAGKLGEDHGRQFGNSFGKQAGSSAGQGFGAMLKDKFRELGPGLVAAVGGLGLFETVKRVIGGASDLNETISKTQQVFKGSSAE